MYDEVLIYDNNYNIVYINKACIRHYSCMPEEMIGKSFFDFIDIDCASIPSDLFESELFGYAKEAFTGASTSGKKGLLEAANNGTILLDEISELSLSAQAKLLLVLQDKEIIPIGSNKPIKVDVRIIAATNQNLKEMIDIGTFREDLYYRINIVEIYLPPLRRRLEDIPYLIEAFMDELCKKYKVKKRLSKDAIDVMEKAEWKGNIRELGHMLERLIVTIEHEVIEVYDLPKNMFDISDLSKDCPQDMYQGTFDERISQYEKSIIEDAYIKCGSSRKVADYLSISQSRANNLIRKYITTK